MGATTGKTRSTRTVNKLIRVVVTEALPIFHHSFIIEYSPPISDQRKSIQWQRIKRDIRFC